MTAAPLLAATPVPRMTIGEEFMQAHVQTWGPDLLSFPLFSPAFCQFLLDAADALGEWGPATGDPSGAPELELDRITPRLSDVVTQIVGRHVNPLLRRLFLGMHAIERVETPRLLRIDAGPMSTAATAWHRQPGAALRFVVALNSDDEGGGFDFPRQQTLVRGLPVGHALMIPGGPSHRHELLPVTAGVQKTLAFRTRPDGEDD